MATRIYQGRIVQARFEDENRPQDEASALNALIETNRLFQDAVNYHLVALAGMAEDGLENLGSRFRKVIREIWSEKPKGNQKACSLQQSVARTLCLPDDLSFEKAVEYIFEGCERNEILPYVLHYVIEQTNKGEGVIQKQSKELLPKLCNPVFGGNFDYSRKGRLAIEGKRKLQQELNREDISDAELVALSMEMDLSWAGIKTQVDVATGGALYHEPGAVKEHVSEIMAEMCSALRKREDSAWNNYAENKRIHDLYGAVLNELKRQPVARTLAKNFKVVPSVKQAAIFFMFYPGQLSAGLLAAKLGKDKAQKKENELQNVEYDFYSLEDDPLILTRGSRGYVYKGFSALPGWESQDTLLYSRNWDILAFAEALKSLHAFELKTQEREKERQKLAAQINYIETGEKTKGITLEDEESDDSFAVLGGDTRFELLQKLVKELSPDTETEYHISTRTLNDYEEVRQLWLKCEEKGNVDGRNLVDIVRQHQAKSKRFGSQLLFEALCREEYRPIWHDYQGVKTAGIVRSENMLRDFSRWQFLCEKEAQYSRDVRITAADAKASPRQLMYSDLESFGERKGCELLSGCKGGMRMQVAIRNEKGRWEATSILMRFSAPRFERDELTDDAANWIVSKNNTSLPWLQPMMKALGYNLPPVHLTRTPAVSLQIKEKGNNTGLYLNFPISLDVDALQCQLGKKVVWDGQFLGTKDEKLHLHWPDTYQGKKIPWWQQAAVMENGFDVLGVDLGIRSAAAWSLVHVSNESTLITSNDSEIEGRFIGECGEKAWYGYVTKQGLSRIAGEGPRVVLGKRVAPVSKPSSYDKVLASVVFKAAGFSLEENDKRDVLQLGNRALTCFQRIVSRLRTYLSFLAGIKDEERFESVLNRMVEYFDYKETITGMRDLLVKRDVPAIYDILYAGTLSLRGKLPAIAESLTSLILPRKHGHWKWIPESREGWQGSGRMQLLPGNDETKRPVYHRGGLSVARLTQLEKLRQLLQSMSKVLSATPGELLPFGRDLKNFKVIDPCPEILDKIEHMREQRVNAIAHEIVAQALGVRLVPSRDGKNADGRDVIHGEYEQIPGRKPVDFVVMENLSRYLTSIERTREENSGLMAWSHRQIVAKVCQMLQEVFGIPVLLTHAAYTSKFDFRTSAPGFRPSPMTVDELQWLKSKENGAENKLATTYLKVLEDLAESGKEHKVTLLMPHRNNGGEYFLSELNGVFTLRNADMNAATNIAWRGIAAPDALHLLHRVRLEMKKTALSPVFNNAREKSVKKMWELRVHRTVTAENGKLAAFALPGEWSKFAFATYGSADNSAFIGYGKEIWSYLKANRWALCHRFNMKQLSNAGIEFRTIEALLHGGGSEVSEPDDDISYDS